MQSPFFGLLRGRLAEALFAGGGDDVRVMMAAWEEANQQMLLWVLVLGAVTAVVGRPERLRLVRRLAAVCLTSGLVSLEGLTEQLEGVVWRDACRDMELGILWAEIQSVGPSCPVSSSL